MRMDPLHREPGVGQEKLTIGKLLKMAPGAMHGEIAGKGGNMWKVGSPIVSIAKRRKLEA